MKTIKKQEEIAFHAITLKDALTLVPLMDELVHIANHNSKFELFQSLPQEQQNEYQRVWRKDTINIPAHCIDGILQLLNDLGFESVLNRHEATIDDLEKK